MKSFGFKKRKVNSRRKTKSIEPVSDFDLLMSRLFVEEMLKSRLLNVAYRDGIRLSPYEIALKWAPYFMDLREQYSEEEIEKTLRWYCQHHRDKYTPKATSASMFSDKYDKIRAAMDRESEYIRPEVIITDEAKLLSKMLGDIVWPGDEKQDELAVIQESLNNYREFLRRIRQVAKSNTLAEFLSSYCSWPTEFVMGWMNDVREMANSKHWGRNLKRHVVSTRSEKFQRIINALCCEHKGKGEYWHLVEEMLK